MTDDFFLGALLLIASWQKLDPKPKISYLSDIYAHTQIKALSHIETGLQANEICLETSRDSG